MASFDGITRICLWSGPRNISTTLMYSFAQRKDTKVFDEPLYAYYLSNSPAVDYHPGASDVLKSLNQNGDEIVGMMMGAHDHPVVFFKNMTHHLLDLKRDFMADVVNVILTRDPKEMIPSFAKVIEQPTIDDIGYRLHSELVDYFEANSIPYFVLDSKKLLLDPKKVLTEFCDLINIEFDESMLSWEKGARPEDGVWAKYWYDNVHRSTGYLAYKPKTEPFPAHLEGLLEECRPHYERLEPKAIS